MLYGNAYGNNMTSAPHTLPAPTDELSPQHRAFIAEYVVHGNATRAYRSAVGNASGRSVGAVRVDACRLLHRPAVAARIKSLRAVAAQALNVDVAELALQAHEIATASMDDLQSIETYGCRCCHGAGFAWQWADAIELCKAMDAALRSANTPKPLPFPDPAGGYGYDPLAAPNPQCPKCRGRGVSMTRITPTSELSAGARALYAGALLNEDGSVQRVLIEDRAKWADMRNKLVGAYAPVKSESKNLHVHYDVNGDALPTPVQAAQLSPADLLRILWKPPAPASVVATQTKAGT